MLKTIFYPTLLLFLLLFCSPIFAQGEGITVDKIIAKIDNHIVLKSDLELALAKLKEQNRVTTLPEYVTCQVLQQLIINKMMLAKAEIDTVKVEESTVNSQLERRMEHMERQFGSREKMEATLGKTAAQLKDELRPQLAEQMTLQKMQQELGKDAKVTPRQIKKFFSAIPKDSVPFVSKEVEVGVLMKMPTVNKNETQRVKEQLLAYKKQVLAGEKFEDLATKHSEDLGSASLGGDLGWQGRGALVPPFEAAALKLEVGQMSEPVMSEFGIHLIQLLDRRGNMYHSRHILLRPKPSEPDLQATIKMMDSLRNQIVAGKVTFEKAASQHSDDKASKMRGGMMADEEEGGTRMTVDNLETGIFMTIDTMKVGSVTKPMQYRLEDGKEAVRMIYFKSMLPPHSITLETDYQKIYNYALSEERNKLMIRWFDKTKKELFIDIDPAYDKCDIMKSF
jgi:peptidyl-prolyl cis-trans isomerase SurA